MNKNPFPPVGDLLAIDPALNNPGAALFRGGVLIAAEKVRIDEGYAELPILDRCDRVAEDIVRWAMARGAEPRYLAVEWPQVYRQTHQKADKRGADPNDLLGLAGVAGAVAGILRLALAPRNVAIAIYSPTPAEWAGQLPKTTKGDARLSPRGHRVLSRLSIAEQLIVPRGHDALDAIGIGLDALGLFEPRRNFAGAVPEGDPLVSEEPRLKLVDETD